MWVPGPQRGADGLLGGPRAPRGPFTCVYTGFFTSICIISRCINDILYNLVFLLYGNLTCLVSITLNLSDILLN